MDATPKPKLVTPTAGLAKPTRRRFIQGAAAVSTFSIIGRAKAQGSGRVTFYTSMPSSYSNQAVLAFNALNTGVEVELFYAPTYQALQRVEAEIQANRMVADVLLIADPGPFLELKERNELLDYVSPHADMYPASQRDPDGIWVNGRTIATMFAYNHNALSPNEAPTTWEAFADSEWTNRIGGIDVRVGGTGYTWYYTLRNHPDLGVRWWQKLAKTNMFLARGHGALMDRMVTGEMPLSGQLDYYVYTTVRDRDAPVTPVYPPEVTPITMAPIAILKRGPNNAGAKVFLDWWLSKEGQETIRDINGIYSPRADVEPLPGKPPFDSLLTMDVDLRDFSESREKLQQEFIDIFDL